MNNEDLLKYQHEALNNFMRKLKIVKREGDPSLADLTKQTVIETLKILESRRKRW